MAESPTVIGTTQDNVAVVSTLVTARFLGALGKELLGTILADTCDGLLVPTAFIAETLKIYDRPLVKPPIS